MSKITFDDLEDFMSFIPVLIQIAISNDDFLDDETSEYFSDISKKVKTVTRKYFVGNPELRLKLKRMLKGFEGNQNVTLTIKADKQQTREQKYLTEKYMTPCELSRKYLKGE